jgi:CBS domain-containing protein
MAVNLLVRDIMTKKVVTVRPDDPLKLVVETLFQHNFDGLPVVNEHDQVVGIVTQYNLVTKSSGLHLPTFEKIFEDLPVLKRDLGPLKRSFEEIQELKVKDLMNNDPLVVGPSETVEVAARLFVAHHRVNPIPVVGKNKKLVGILSRYDVIRLFDPQHFASALGGVVEDAMDHNERGIESETVNILHSVRKSLILVSRWRSRLLYFLFVILVILAFLAIVSIIMRS